MFDLSLQSMNICVHKHRHHFSSLANTLPCILSFEWSGLVRCECYRWLCELAQHTSHFHSSQCIALVYLLSLTFFYNLLASIKYLRDCSIKCLFSLMSWFNRNVPVVNIGTDCMLHSRIILTLNK